jgi:hypothetical protein
MYQVISYLQALIFTIQENQVIGTLFVNGKGFVYPEFNRIELEYKTDDGVTVLDYYSLYER